MDERQRFASIDDYIASASPHTRPILEEIRRTVRATVPAAQETISYQMPAFRLGRTFIYFAAFKKHVGVYPPVQADEDLSQALLPYRGPKGNLRFPLDQPMPYDLISRVAAALSVQYARRREQNGSEKSAALGSNGNERASGG